MSFFYLLILLIFYVLVLLIIIMRGRLLLFIMWRFFFFFLIFFLSLLLSVICLVIFFFSYELFFFVKWLIKLLSLCRVWLIVLFLSWMLCDWTKTFVCIGGFNNLLISCFFVRTNFLTIWSRFYTSDLSISLNFSYISSIFINLSYRSTSLSNRAEVWPYFAKTFRKD